MVTFENAHPAMSGKIVEKMNLGVIKPFIDISGL
jgi:hypothetical protein